MSKGMGKFTKGCLITALVTFLIGLFMFGIGALLGGLRVLDGVDIEGITGIPFVFHHSPNGGLRYSFGWDDDWEDWADVDWSGYENWSSVSGSDAKVELELTADTLHNLDMEMGACDVYIMETENEHVSIDVKGKTKYFRYLVEDDGSLSLTHTTGTGYLSWTHHTITPTTKIYLYLPKGVMLDKLDVEIGAGNMESVELRAKEISLEVGAGNCTIDSFASAGKTDLLVGAGNITLDSLMAGSLALEVGAGQLYIDDVQVGGKTDINIGVGNIELGGVFSGDMDLECDMGNVTLRLDDAEDNHNYDIDCSVGNVRVGSHSYTGLADEMIISNGSASTYDIECSVGDVKITFAE